MVILKSMARVFVGNSIRLVTLFACPNKFQRFYSDSKLDSRNLVKIGVQSAEFSGGTPVPSVEDGPSAIKRAGFIDNLERIGNITVKDYGTIDIPSFSPKLNEQDVVFRPNDVLVRNVKQVGFANKAISDSVVKILKTNDRCLTLVGDHSIGIGTMHGASQVYNDLFCGLMPIAI